MFSIDSLFTEFMPHGHCYGWDPLILTMSVISDAIIALSYFSIPIALIYLVRKRRDLLFHRVFLLFAIFILACGLTHVIEIWNIWHGSYGFAAIAKAVTAIASIGTAFVLFGLIPKAINIPSNAQLDQLNQQLVGEVNARKTAQEEILRFNQDLEQRVAASNKSESEALEQFRALADNIPQLVWVAKSNGQNEYFNRRWTEYSGSKPQTQLNGTGWMHIFHPDDVARAIERWNLSLQTGKTYQVESRLKAADGSYHWFLAWAEPLRNSQNEIIKWFGTFTDINSQKIQ